jgi:adenylyl cyclase-associated protein
VALAPPPEPVPESIEEFDNFINQSVKKYVDNSNEIGGLVAEQVSGHV